MKNTMIRVTGKDNQTCYLSVPAKNADKMVELLKDGGNTATVELFEVGTMPLDSLPEDIQNEVKSTLKAYNNVSVVYENFKFSTSVGVCIKSHYNFDHFVCGRYAAEDVYTEEERRANYKEVFGY